MTKRRKFLIALSMGMLALPLGSFAQQPGKVWRVGYLSSFPTPASKETGSTGIVMRGLRDLGYVDGRNLVVEWRFADGGYDRLPLFASELVKLGVDIIVADGSPAIR